MNHNIVKQIVEEVFEKAKIGSPSHSLNALTNFIEEHSRLSYKTLERAHKKYIDEEETGWSPNGDSVKNFCKFLDYEDYEDYVEKNEKDETNPKPERSKKNKKWILTIKITIVLALMFILYQYVSSIIWKKENGDKPLIECMAWAENHYEKVDCDLQLHPKYGTKVESFSPKKSKSMKKIDVNAATLFFSEETGKPLIWYYKTKEGTIEYFTVPGLHPVNGETLKKITEGIIEKYVPIHKTQPDSFILTDIVYSAKAGIAILVLNKNEFDDKLTESLKTNYFNNNTPIIRLKNSDIYNKDFISRFNLKEKLLLQNKSILLDTVLLGLSHYSYSNDTYRENMIICNAQIDFSIHHKTNGIWNEFLSKSINSIGLGYSEIEAKTNAIKKINYE